MWTFVVVFNFSLALVGLYAAWQVWRLGRGLRQVAEVLAHAERQTSTMLHHAPDAIAQGQYGAYRLRQQVQQIEPQVQRLKQAIALINLVQSLWGGGFIFGTARRQPSKKASSRVMRRK